MLTVITQHIGKVAYGFRIRVERVATSPMCNRCGEHLDDLERHAGRCFDCEVIELVNNHMLVHDYGVTEMVAA